MKVNHAGDAITRIRAALARAKTAQDAQDWNRVQTLLRLALESAQQAAQ